MKKYLNRNKDEDKRNEKEKFDKFIMLHGNNTNFDVNTTIKSINNMCKLYYDIF